MHELDRGHLLAAIEGIVQPVLHGLEAKEQREIRLCLISPNTGKQFQVTLNQTGSHRRMAVFMVVLDALHELLKSGATRTMRDLYYQHTALFRKQDTVRNALLVIARTLGVPRYQLPVVSAVKGLVCGGGLSCQSVDNVKSFELDEFGFVLIVEKEAVFHTIKEAYGALSQRLGPFILVTGKGYPCLGTRRFLKQVATKFDRRMFIMVDHDPYGMEIAWLYREGSGFIPAEDEELCLELHLLGLTAQQIDEHAPGQMRSTDKLGKRDAARLSKLLRKSEGKWPELHEQQLLMQGTGMTAEIEILSDNGDYFTETILPLLLQSRLYSA